MIILRAVKGDTSVEKSLFKHIVIGDRIFPSSSFCEEAIVFVHRNSCTSVEQSLFMQIVIGDRICHSSSLL